MSADPNVSPPTKAVSNVEPFSADPVEGQGAHHRLLDPSLNALRRGRIDDVYMDSFCAVVSVYSYRARVPCVWVEGMMSRYSGAKSSRPPSVGTEVLVWLPNDHKFGVIIGTVNSPADAKERTKLSVANTPIAHDSDQEIHKAEDWGMKGFLMRAAQGLPNDVLPGDDVVINESGALNALFKFVSIMQGGDGAKIETFIFDQLLRINAFNYQFYGAGSEVQTFSDHGRVTEVEQLSHLQNEAIYPQPDPIPDPDPNEGRETGQWRFKRFKGALGNLIQRFIVRPFFGEPTLNEPENKPDLGLSQHISTISGHEIIRSVVSVGLHKSNQIAVPKKRFEVDDPEGDHTEPETKPVEDFEFSEDPDCAMSRVAQLRDYLAWMLNHNINQRLVEQPKDWDVPDEANCPVVGSGDIHNPRPNGFYREVMPLQDAMGGATPGTYPDDAKTEGSKKMSLGDAFVELTVDGCVVLKSQCGAQLTLGHGHIEFSASNDVRTIAGGSVISLAGDDQVIKARQSVDITSTLGQLRVKAEQDLFVYADKGGMLISTGTPGYAFVNKPGEAKHLSGIAIKVPDGALSVSGAQATFNLSSRFYLNGLNGTFPEFETDATSVLHRMHGGAWALSTGVMMLGNGGIYARGPMHCDGYVFGRTTVLSCGPVSPFCDCTDVKYIDVSPLFNSSIWTKFQYPYTLDQLKELQFGYRTMTDYATKDGKWFASFWQMDLADRTDKWEEKSSKDGEYPYPGKEHFGSKKSFWLYEQGNIDKDGRYLPRTQQKKDAGKFTPVNWNSLPVSPYR